MDISYLFEKMEILENTPYWQNIGSIIEEDYSDFFGFEMSENNNVSIIVPFVQSIFRMNKRFRKTDEHYQIRKIIKKSYPDLYRRFGMDDGDIFSYEFAGTKVIGFDLGEELPTLIIYQDPYTKTFLCVCRYGDYNFIIHNDVFFQSNKNNMRLQLKDGKAETLLGKMRDFIIYYSQLQ